MKNYGGIDSNIILVMSYIENTFIDYIARFERNFYKQYFYSTSELYCRLLMKSSYHVVIMICVGACMRAYMNSCIRMCLDGFAPARVFAFALAC